MSQPSVNMQSVQVTYRIFLRDMFPGWIVGMWIAYLINPRFFDDNTAIVLVAVASFIWSPVVGLLVNAIGYILFGWLLENKIADFLFGFVFRREERATQKYILHLAELIGMDKGKELQKFREELFDRLAFIIRTSGWSDRDEVVERIRGVHQTARSLAFIFGLFSLLYRSSQLPIGNTTSILGWQVFVPLALLFLFLAWFLYGYARLTEIHLLYELVSFNQLSLSILKIKEQEVKRLTLAAGDSGFAAEGTGREPAK
jgi:hypothetical protein